MTIFYTYMWLREDGTPYYVGKGTRSRAYRREGPASNLILIEPHTSEKEAFEAERFLINYYGRKDLGTGILRNRSDGGEGVSGWNAENRKKLSLLRLGKPLSLEHREKLSRSHKGKKLTPESIQKRTDARHSKAWNKAKRRDSGGRHKYSAKQTPESIRKRTDTRRKNGWNRRDRDEA